MTERGKSPVIREPAIAIAVAKCWLARTQSSQFGAFHPEECGFCEMPLDMLMSALKEFGVWSGLSYRSDKYDPLNPTVNPWRYEVESFAKLPSDDQKRLVAEAQGYVEEKE